MSKGKRQGGSVGVFIIVGIVLTLIALGALYGARHIAMNDQTPPMAIDGVTDGNGSTDDASKSGQGSEGAGSQESQGTDGQEQGGSTQTPAPNGQNGTSGQGQTESNGTGTTNTNGSGSTGGTGALPRSGAAENLNALVLAVITAASVAFIRSLRKV